MSQPIDYPDMEEYQLWLDTLPDCHNCDGTGEITDDFDHDRTCPECGGMGKQMPETEEDYS
jgi:DnaJ-class molecular chaperone